MPLRDVKISMLLALVLHTAVAFAAPEGISFNRDIRPLLSEHCFACHGPDPASRQGELRLDTREGASGAGVILPGNAAASELIARITSDDPEKMMPPPEARKRLKPEDKLLLSRWIDDGASWEEHWAFIRPQQAELPHADSPATGSGKWTRNAIDHFVLEKITALGLEPSKPANRHTLARRAALDLTGLPPSPEMLESFVTDGEEAAYERYVDQLLISTHAGEHRARYWLDAARYGDTHGMHVDNYREIWPYRDWVIRAFNSNMPFDQFVIEQIAGDLLPESTMEQRIATGFNRCNITTSEGGAIPEEVNVRYMVDRVETTATVFLGLTAGCAVCHDHKYDPISQREFYQFGAFFNNTTQPAMDGNEKDTPPVVTLPSVEFEGEWNSLRSRRNELRSVLSQWSPDIGKWWASHPRKIDHPVTPDKLLLSLPLTEGEGDPIQLPDSARWAQDHPAGRRGLLFGEGGGLTLDLPPLRSDEPLTLSFWFRTPDRVMRVTLFDQTRKLEDHEFDTATDDLGEDEQRTTDKDTLVGWRLHFTARSELTLNIFDGHGNLLEGAWPDNEALRPRAWQHACVRYSGGQSDSSITMLIDGKAGALRKGTEGLIDAADLADTPLKIGSDLPTGALSDLRIFRRWVSDEEVRILAKDHVLKGVLETDTDWSRLEEKDRDLLTHFHNQALDADYRAHSRELSGTESRRDFIYSRSTTTLVSQELPSAPRAWVLERGEYTKKLDEVTPGVPAVLPPLPGGARGNRLGLARWLVHPDHPLTARVMVNRLWQSVFGVGLVKTSEDFGVMGAPPSNQKLLDWLAVEFVESGWNLRHILKLITTSATYRQSSVVTPEKLQKDRDNRFLSRGPRLRLDAEVLRDQALAVSGILREDIGGPSVRPYQPAGLWKVVAITGSNTANFKQDTGDALYRRSLYTFWKRTSPPPSMAAFNAPTREQCTVRRERTNTPLQALVLMNDPQFVEAARHLAERALKRNSDDQARATWMLTTVLSHPERAADVTDVLSAARDFRAIFTETPDAAKELINTGDSTPDPSLEPTELATWTLVANTLMNRDDFINKQ
jgi:hypothetical protein